MTHAVKKIMFPGWGRFVTAGAWMSLLTAFIFGQIAAQTDYEELLRKGLPQLELMRYGETTELPAVYLEVDPSQPVMPQGKIPAGADMVIVAEGEGYSGPLLVGVLSERTDEGGVLSEIVVLSQYETPAFFRRIQKSRFFHQFTGKNFTDDFILGEDIDAVSGATVSSAAITEAARQAVHRTAVQHFGLDAVWKEQQWKIGIDEIAMVVLFVAAFVGVYRRDRVGKFMRRTTPLAALVFVGFYSNSSISLGSLAAIVMGYVPDMKSHPLWWIMMVTILGTAIFLGRNIYCNRLCPFSTVQDLLQKISGVRWRIRRDIQRKARGLILFISWIALMLIFLSVHPALGSYEPFAMMFSLDGVGIQWYIFPATLIGMFFVPGFWCRLFCPVGLFLNEIIRLRRSVRGFLTGKTRQAARAKGVAIASAKAKKRKSQKPSWHHRASLSWAVLVLLLIFAFFAQSFIAIQDAKSLSVAIERLTDG
jgi:polyferredoxin/Na+-translocating ferredoxin:NAD+ oxidoreductase RnfG subunit